jgi:K+-sensing histidine kinase KdpD
VVQAILDFAHEKRITRIMVGRTRPCLLNRLFDRSTMRRLIEKARDFDVHVVSDGEVEEER